MPRSKPDWQRTVEGQYFLKLPNGDYARLYFTMISYGDHFCTVDSLLNRMARVIFSENRYFKLYFVRYKIQF